VFNHDLQRGLRCHGDVSGTVHDHIGVFLVCLCVGGHFPFAPSSKAEYQVPFGARLDFSHTSSSLTCVPDLSPRVTNRALESVILRKAPVASVIERILAGSAAGPRITKSSHIRSYRCVPKPSPANSSSQCLSMDENEIEFTRF
jgi:hypothetical protein